MKSDEELIWEAYVLKESPLTDEFEGIEDYDDPEDSFEAHFDGETPYETMGYKTYYGRNVEWIGKDGYTIKVDSEYVSSREDNITDNRKVRAVMNHIRTSEDRVKLDTPPADIRIIDEDYISETQEEHARDALYESRLNRPFTSGDSDVDKYLYMSAKEFAEHMGIDSDYVNDDQSPNIEEIKQYEDDEEDIESLAEEIIETFSDIETKLKELKETNSGDFGQIWAVLRDGNHRTWGAILSGEEYVFVRPHVYNNSELDRYKNILI